MTAESKLRTLAAADSTLQGFFGTPLFRWFDRQLQPGYIQNGSCVRVLRVSTIRVYQMLGLQNLSQPRFQIDVLDFDSETARSAAAAVISWLGTISLANTNQFSSPVTTPPQFPCFVLNQRAGMEYQLAGGAKPSGSAASTPAYVESIDVRVFNLEN